MTVYFLSTAFRGCIDELYPIINPELQASDATLAAMGPSGRTWLCADNVTGGNNSFTLTGRRNRPAGTPTIGWLTFLVRMSGDMTAGTNWTFTTIPTIAVDRASSLRIARTAGGVYNFTLCDSAGTVLATGSTGLAKATTYTCKLTLDESGATNRAVTLYLWNGSAWVSEATYTGGGKGSAFYDMTFGTVRAKGVAGCGTSFYISDIYCNDNSGSYENTDPASPTYLLGYTPNAVGTYDEWPGNAADVDDSPDNDGDTTSDECGTGTAVERQTYAMRLQNANIPADQEIACVAMLSTMKMVAGAYANVGDAIFKLGASDTFDSQIWGGAWPTYATPTQNIQEQSPAGGDWAVSDMGTTAANANVELGIRRQAQASDPMNVRLTMLAGYVAYRTAAAAPPSRRIFIC